MYDRSPSVCRPNRSAVGWSHDERHPDHDRFRLPHRARHDGRGQGSRPRPCGAPRPSARWRTSRSPACRSSRRYIHALALIKAAAARVNAELGVLDRGHRRRRSQAAAPRSPPASTTTSSRSTSSRPAPARRRNMNANEVLATLATRALGDAGPPERPRQRHASRATTCSPRAIHVAATDGDRPTT